jgi:hypothetical protein
MGIGPGKCDVRAPQCAYDQNTPWRATWRGKRQVSRNVSSLYFVAINRVAVPNPVSINGGSQAPRGTRTLLRPSPVPDFRLAITSIELASFLQLTRSNVRIRSYDVQKNVTIEMYT